MKLRLAASVALSGLLAACVNSGGGDTIVPLPSELVRTGRVAEISVNAPAGASAEFPAVFRTRAQERLNRCATGQRPLNLQVDVTEFRRANAAATLLVGSSNSIRGVARLVDPATGGVVGDYEINRSVGGGGILAVAGMAEAEEQMSTAFAEELCNRAFGGR